MIANRGRSEWTVAMADDRGTGTGRVPAGRARAGALRALQVEQSRCAGLWGAVTCSTDNVVTKTRKTAHQGAHTASLRLPIRFPRTVPATIQHGQGEVKD